MIDLRQLQALRAIAEEGSVAKAALALGWSQPSVYHHLGNLERTLGVAMVSRRSTGTYLTSTGKFMLARGNEILDLCEQATEDVLALSAGPKSTVRFGAFPTVGAMVLPEVVDRLAGIGVGVEATLDEVSSLVNGINKGTLDVALMFTAGGTPPALERHVDTERVHAERILLAIPEDHRFASQSSVSLDDLAGLRDAQWVFGSSNYDSVDEAVLALCRRAGFEPKIGLRTDNYRVALGMIAAGLAVGFVPELGLVAEIDGVTAKPVDGSKLRREIDLVVRRQSVGPAVVDLITTAVRAVLGRE